MRKDHFVVRTCALGFPLEPIGPHVGQEETRVHETHSLPSDPSAKKKKKKADDVE